MNKKIAGFVIIVITLVSIMIWEFWGRENVYYRSVITLKEDTDAHTVVKAEDFTVKKIERPSDKALTEKDLNNLQGMETTHFIAAGTELRRDYFSESYFTVDEESGRALMAISQQWLLSYPQTLKRGDKVRIYNGTVKLVEGVVAHAKDSGGQEIVFGDEQRMSMSGVLSHIEIIAKENELVEVSRLAGQGARLTLTTVR